LKKQSSQSFKRLSRKLGFLVKSEQNDRAGIVLFFLKMKNWKIPERWL